MPHVPDTDAPFRAADRLAALAPGFVPEIGMVLGSGLGALREAIEDVLSLDYQALPGFPNPGVAGHAGRLILGRIAGINVACLHGRAHFYEGHGLGAMAVPIRVLKLLGAKILIVTNAAGSLRPEIGPGRLVMAIDHLNLMPGTPLIGANDARFGPRFPALKNAYDPGLRQAFHQAARHCHLELAEGVYAAVAGPCFETAAEIRMIARLGGDLIGMSSVPEVILARHCDLKVAMLSLIANLAEGLSAEALSHENTLRAAEAGSGALVALIRQFITQGAGSWH